MQSLRPCCVLQRPSCGSQSVGEGGCWGRQQQPSGQPESAARSRPAGASKRAKAAGLGRKCGGWDSKDRRQSWTRAGLHNSALCRCPGLPCCMEHVTSVPPTGAAHGSRCIAMHRPRPSGLTLRPKSAPAYLCSVRVGEAAASSSCWQQAEIILQDCKAPAGEVTAVRKVVGGSGLQQSSSAQQQQQWAAGSEPAVSATVGHLHCKSTV